MLIFFSSLLLGAVHSACLGAPVFFAWNAQPSAAALARTTVRAALPAMGGAQSQPVQLTLEENRRLREYSVYTALLLSLGGGAAARNYPGAGLSPAQMAPLALDGSHRSNRSSPATSMSRPKEPTLPPIKHAPPPPPPPPSSSYDA